MSSDEAPEEETFIASHKKAASAEKRIKQIQALHNTLAKKKRRERQERLADQTTPRRMLKELLAENELKEAAKKKSVHTKTRKEDAKPKTKRLDDLTIQVVPQTRRPRPKPANELRLRREQFLFRGSIDRR